MSISFSKFNELKSTIYELYSYQGFVAGDKSNIISEDIFQLIPDKTQKRKVNIVSSNLLERVYPLNSDKKQDAEECLFYLYLFNEVYLILYSYLVEFTIAEKVACQIDFLNKFNQIELKQKYKSVLNNDEVGIDIKLIEIARQVQLPIHYKTKNVKKTDVVIFELLLTI